MALFISDRIWTLSLISVCLLLDIVKSLDAGKASDFRIFQKSYRFEDFFWTGSGDGPPGEDLYTNDTRYEVMSSRVDSFNSWRTTTVFHTTTILFATVYPNTKLCAQHGCVPQISPVQTESLDLSLTTPSSGKESSISPSPSSDFPHSTKLSNLPDFIFNSNRIDSTAKAFPDSSNVFSTAKLFPTISTFLTGHPDTSESFADDSHTATPVFPESFLDQKYWLLTVLRNDDHLPNLEFNSTENKLSALYRQALNRRPGKYSGGSEFSDRRERKMSQVKAHIVNVTQIGNDIGLIYSVTVAGKPVPAISAANDMRLMTASEIIAELGRPVLTKAEPYVKSLVPLGARVRGKTRDTWLLIGSVIAAIFLLLVLVMLFAIILSKNQTRKNSGKLRENQKRVFQEEGGRSNLAFDEDADLKNERHKTASTARSNKTIQESGSTTVKFEEIERRGSLSSSSCSVSSDAGLMRLQKKRCQKDEESERKPKPKPRTRDRRIQSTNCDCNTNRRTCVTSAESKNTFDESVTDDYSPRILKSPTSYLSMPSVKAFPRGLRIPEPMNKILEPTSIRHLDADSESPRTHIRRTQSRQTEVEIERACETRNKFVKGKCMTRHASLEGDDPGFIGPIVWDRHCQKIIDRDTDILNEEEYDNVGRMRKRFNELLDDALSMFGSRNGSPEENDFTPVKQLDNRIHSAVVRPAEFTSSEVRVYRPNTTGSKRPQSSVTIGPKGAWETPSSSTLGRPISAGTWKETSPSIDKDIINVNSKLPPGDPAVPLIAAIKSELKKFDSQPGNKSLTS